MCLSIPGKVLEIKGKKAIVEGEGHTHEVDLSLVKNVAVGDYVLVHTDLALNKVDKEDAMRITKAIKKMQAKAKKNNQ